MKTIIQKTIGGDGATVALGTDDSGNLTLTVAYPIAKLMGPADTAIDDAVAKIEAALSTQPWVAAVLGPLDIAIKGELAALLAP